MFAHSVQIAKSYTQGSISVQQQKHLKPHRSEHFTLFIRRKHQLQTQMVVNDGAHQVCENIWITIKSSMYDKERVLLNVILVH